MTWVAGYRKVKRKGSKPRTVSKAAMQKICGFAGVDYDQRVEHEKENKYTGEFYGIWAMVCGEVPDLDCDRFRPEDFASASRAREGSFSFGVGGRHDSEHAKRQFLDLIVGSVGEPVYRLDHQEGSYFSPSREALEKVGYGPVVEIEPYSIWSCCLETYIPVLKPASGRKVALLFSGGIGSMVAAGILKRQSYDVMLLNLLEGSPERARSAGLLAVSLNMKIDYHKLPDPRNDLVGEYEPGATQRFLPSLAILSAWGAKAQVNYLSIPDMQASPGVDKAARELLRASSPKTNPVGYINPILGLSKVELIKEAGKMNLNILKARSCLTDPIYCGHCEKCVEWAEAFEQTGQDDPRSALK